MVLTDPAGRAPRQPETSTPIKKERVLKSSDTLSHTIYVFL